MAALEGINPTTNLFDYLIGKIHVQFFVFQKHFIGTKDYLATYLLNPHVCDHYCFLHCSLVLITLLPDFFLASLFSTQDV